MYVLISNNLELVLEKKSIVHWLPNFCTTLTCFFGFLALTSAASGAIDKSCYYVFFAAVTDFLDGRVARMTGNESDFGAAYDSLADIIAFGIAPAIIAYYSGLLELGKIGWSCAFLYATATALRLARFNTSEADPGYFIGMPCPAAALLVTGYILFLSKLPLLILILHTVSAAILQVSNVPFKHTKKIKVPSKHRLIFLLGLVTMVCAIFVYPAGFIYGLMLAYVLFSIYSFCLSKQCT